GQDRFRSRAAWMTVEPASRIRRPAALRSLPVRHLPVHRAGVEPGKDAARPFRWTYDGIPLKAICPRRISAALH
ncbi:hypothetical protein, partial [Streptomyces sp. NPDC058394]|uniref:hypothetical protein n=1 Tax=Streptomyces sp. NPDC058394 TaxID=3346477 RepID=UPI003647D331